MVDVLIQTHNEELNLGAVLASLSGWVNKVFVVDSGSTDGTLEIARAAGAIVIHHDWEGYAGQKNWALANVSWESDWILIVDADEAVTPKLRQEIETISAKPVERVRESGFYINRMFVFMGKPIRHCGYYPSWNLRLFKRGRARYEQRRVHEHMLVDGPTAYLKGILLHEDRRGLEHFIAKHNRYSTLEAMEIYESHSRWPGLSRFLSDRMVRRRFLKTAVLPGLPVPWFWKFLYMYIFLEGFLDRAAGWNLCLFISTYEYFIHVKYKELRRLKARQPIISGLSVAEGTLRANTLQADDQRVSTVGNAAANSNVATVTASVSRSSAFEGPSPAFTRRAPDKVPVSVMIPALNESKNLPRCLDHLTWADEVVIVDSGSKDNTQEIADRYSARVVQFTWDGQWPKKKNWSLANIDFKHEWVLIVDADEWITPELADEISEAVKTTTNVGYYINRKFIFMGGWIRHCGYYPSWNLRLIRRGCGEYERLTDIGDTGSGDNEVHEHISANGPVGHLNSDMLHFAFPSINTFIEKHNRYSNWEAAVQYKNRLGEKADIGGTLSGTRRLKNLTRWLPFRPTLRFIYSYVFRGGFLDGRAGYVFCRLLAIYEFLSVAKYTEMKRRETDDERMKSLSAVPVAQATTLRAAAS
jgi:glycosyltransferase involved in cell wall biosynthesis